MFLFRSYILIQAVLVYPNHLKIRGSARIDWLSDKASIWRSSGSKSKIDNAVWKPIKLAQGSVLSVLFHRQRTWKGLVITLRPFPRTRTEGSALNHASWGSLGIYFYTQSKNYWKLFVFHHFLLFIHHFEVKIGSWNIF